MRPDKAMAFNRNPQHIASLLHYAPPGVKPTQLYKNYKLLPDELIERIKKDIEKDLQEDQEILALKKENPKAPIVRRYLKTRFNIPYGIHYDNGNTYIIYKTKIASFKSKEEIPPQFNPPVDQASKPQYDIYETRDKDNNPIYEIYKQFELGKGNSPVKLAQMLNGTWATLKTIKKNIEIKESTAKRSALHEVQMIKKIMNHETHVCLRESKFHKANKINFTMKLAKGTPLNVLIQNRKDPTKPEHSWPPLLWLRIFLEIVKTLRSHIHGKDVIHRDIKPRNIVVNLADMEINKSIYSHRNHCYSGITIIDYDFARDCQNLIYISKNIVGTKGYRAPELEEKSEKYQYDELTEVYALGTTLRKLIENMPEKNPDEDNVVKRLNQFSEKLMSKKPKERTTIFNIIKGCHVGYTQFLGLEGIYDTFSEEKIQDPLSEEEKNADAVVKGIILKAKEDEKKRLEELVKIVESKNDDSFMPMLLDATSEESRKRPHSTNQKQSNSATKRQRLFGGKTQPDVAGNQLQPNSRPGLAP